MLKGACDGIARCDLPQPCKAATQCRNMNITYMHLSMHTQRLRHALAECDGPHGRVGGQHVPPATYLNAQTSWTCASATAAGTHTSAAWAMSLGARKDRMWMPSSAAVHALRNNGNRHGIDAYGAVGPQSRAAVWRAAQRTPSVARSPSSCQSVCSQRPAGRRLR